MKTKALLSLLLVLSACGDLPPPPDYRFPPTFPAASDGGTLVAGGCTSAGSWGDATTCTAGVLAGCFYADWGCVTPSKLGVVGATCVPPSAVKIKARCGHESGLMVPGGCPRYADGGYACAVSDGTAPCTISVDPAGNATLEGNFVAPGQKVCWVAQ